MVNPTKENIAKLRKGQSVTQGDRGLSRTTTNNSSGGGTKTADANATNVNRGAAAANAAAKPFQIGQIRLNEQHMKLITKMTGIQK